MLAAYTDADNMTSDPSPFALPILAACDPLRFAQHGAAACDLLSFGTVELNWTAAVFGGLHPGLQGGGRCDHVPHPLAGLHRL